MSCKERLPTEKITSAKCNLLVLSLKEKATAMNLGQGPLESTVFVLLHHKDVRVAPVIYAATVQCHHTLGHCIF